MSPVGFELVICASTTALRKHEHAYRIGRVHFALYVADSSAVAHVLGPKNAINRKCIHLVSEKKKPKNTGLPIAHQHAPKTYIGCCARTLGQNCMKLI